MSWATRRADAHLSLLRSDFSLKPLRKSDFSNASDAASALDLMASAAWLAGPGPSWKMGSGMDSRPKAWLAARHDVSLTDCQTSGGHTDSSYRHGFTKVGKVYVQAR